MSSNNERPKLDLEKANEDNPWLLNSGQRWLEGYEKGFNDAVEAYEAYIKFMGGTIVEEKSDE